MSQSEADEKERQKKMLTQKYAMSSFLSAPANDPPLSVPESNHEYSELSKYIERGRQEQQKQQEKTNPSNVSNGYSAELTSTLPDELNKFITDNEIDQFTTVVTDHINNFKFRMLSNQQRNRNITNDTAVQSVFVMLQHFYPELNRFMQLLEDKRAYYENLQDKLNQLKDAREALNALRTEHHERKQQEAIERDRQRQIQLAQKLDFMRQKKQEYLEYQRQLHLQRLAQQELEMKTRLEQQRQLTLAREQLVQNPQLSMAAYDYNQIPPQNPVYQPPYNTLPTQPMIDPTNQYSSMTSYPTQQPLPPTHYPSMMMYPPKTDTNLLPSVPVPLQMQPMSFPMGPNGDNHYNLPSGQLPMTNTNMFYPPHQQSTPAVNDQKSEQQLIIFD
jgi:growth factor-regulated tyrosine kinase substrate